MKAARFLVTGRVQGVSYRAFTRETASTLGLSGWVRNLEDGRVEAWVEGPEDRIRQLAGALERGPHLARVTSVHAESVDPEGLEGFVIRRG